MADPSASPFTSEIGTPVHCEAYPGFAIKTADKQWRDDVRYCEWEDRFGSVVGQLELLTCEQAELAFSYSCGRSTYVSQRRLGLRIARVHLPSDRYEARVFCPACNTIKDRLFFRWDRWACQQCQQLVQRRSIATGTDRLRLRREQLIRAIHHPHNATKSHLATLRPRRELQAIDQQLADEGSAWVVPFPLSAVISARWFDDARERATAYAVDASAYLDEQRLR